MSEENTKTTRHEPWEGEHYRVSPFNHVPEVRQMYNFREPVVLWDVTPEKMDHMEGGRLYSPEEYVELARLLEGAGVQETKFITGVYVGTPKGDSVLQGLRAVGKAGLNLEIVATCFDFLHTWRDDQYKSEIDMLADYGATGLHVSFHPPPLPNSQYPDPSRQSRDAEVSSSYQGALSEFPKAVEYAKKKGLYVTACGHPAYSQDLANLIGLLNYHIDQGVDALLLSDSKGYCTPEATRYFITEVRKGLKEDVPIYYHAHNNFGLGTSLALAAASAGAWPHVAVNGIGDRGFASLEEVAAALEMLYGVKTGINLQKLPELSRAVERMTGISMPPQKAVTGEFINIPSHKETFIGIAKGQNWLSLDGPFDPLAFGRSPSLPIWYATLHRDVVEAMLERAGLPTDETTIKKSLEALKVRLDSLGNKFPVLLNETEVEAICRESIGA